MHSNNNTRSSAIKELQNKFFRNDKNQTQCSWMKSANSTSVLRCPLSYNLDLLQVVQLLSQYVLPDKKDFEFGASYGLITYQEFHQMDIQLMVKGKITNN